MRIHLAKKPPKKIFFLYVTLLISFFPALAARSTEISLTGLLVLLVVQVLPALFLIFSFFPRYLPQKIFAAASVVILAVFSILPMRAMLYALMPFAFVTLCAAAYVHFSRQNEKLADFFTHLFLGETVCALLCLESMGQKYAFIRGGFFPAAFLAAGAVFLIAVLILRTRLKQVIGSLLFFLCLFILLANGTFCHLNYLLDDDPPEPFAAVIEEKRIERRRTGKHGSQTDYVFSFTANGESGKMDVSKSTYDAYEEGDTFACFRYDGAFGKPFFLPAP